MLSGCASSSKTKNKKTFSESFVGGLVESIFSDDDDYYQEGVGNPATQNAWDKPSKGYDRPDEK